MMCATLGRCDSCSDYVTCPQHFQASFRKFDTRLCHYSMAPKLGQQNVRSLRADGMSESAIREHLKAMGYKTGRVTQLLAATAASGSRDVPATMDTEAGTK